MTNPSILYDGWPLVYAPDSPAALHLLTLLEMDHAGFNPILIVPAELKSEAGFKFQVLVQETEDTARNRSRWVQRVLPETAKRHQVDALHVVGEQASLNAHVPVFVSPASLGHMPPKGLGGRVRAALGAGGLGRCTILWPEDLAAFAPDNALLLPPIAPALLPAGDGLPVELADEETFILYHGPSRLDVLKKVLDTWTWAHQPIGSFFPLVFAGLAAEARGYVRFYADEYDIAESVYVLPQQSPAEMAALYVHCAAVFHPAQAAPWGDAVRLALAFGKPLISYEHAEVEAVVGAAGFLLEDDHARTLAGGIIAITNKESVVAELEGKAAVQAGRWDRADFYAALKRVYAAL